MDSRLDALKGSPSAIICADVDGAGANASDNCNDKETFDLDARVTTCLLSRKEEKPILTLSRFYGIFVT